MKGVMGEIGEYQQNTWYDTPKNLIKILCSKRTLNMPQVYYMKYYCKKRFLSNPNLDFVMKTFKFKYLMYM